MSKETYIYLAQHGVSGEDNAIGASKTDANAAGDDRLFFVFLFLFFIFLNTSRIRVVEGAL